jgi:hypothetical protein
MEFFSFSGLVSQEVKRVANKVATARNKLNFFINLGKDVFIRIFIL